MRTSLAAIATCLVSGTALAQSINEIRVQQTGVDAQVYAEIAGTPGASLSGLTYLVIGNDDFQLPPQQNGSIEAVIPLDGKAIPSSGFFVLAEPTYSLTTPDLVAALGFAADNNKTHMIVEGFFGFVGDDIDLNDDGVIDNALWNSMVSSVALLSTTPANGTVGDYVYSSTQVGPDGGAFPSHVRKCGDSVNWTVGFADVAAGGDTPGAANPACANNTVVLINEIRQDQVVGTNAADNDEYIELAGTPGASLDGLTYLVLGDGSSTSTKSGVIEMVLKLDGYTIPANGLFLITSKNTWGTGDGDGIAFGKAGTLQATQFNLENSDHVTHLLVRGYTGWVPAATATQSTIQSGGTDLDTNDDGALDGTLPWTSVVDSVAMSKIASTGPVKDPSGEWVYQVSNADGGLTPIVGPDTSTSNLMPWHIYRCSPQGSWKIGKADPTAAGADNKDTPSAQNAECAACGEPGSGNCFAVHPTPGCDRASCCSTVCALTPACCSVQWDATCVNNAFTYCLASGQAPTLQLSEMRIADPDNSEANEYVEISGTPGTSLTGVWLVVLNKQDSGTFDEAGVVATAIDLTGQPPIPSSGKFVITDNSFNLPGVIPDYKVGSSLKLDNSGTLTFLLTWNFYGNKNDDLDATNDGTLDSTPWISLIDSVAVRGDAGKAYSTITVGPSAGKVPAQVYRCDPAGEWRLGPTSIVSGYDTPGVSNAGCSLPRVYQCGDLDAGDCFQPHSNAHCLNRACCEAVCAVVPDCCSLSWDSLCTDAAGTLSACGAGGQVLINEVRLDQDGADNDEYIELKGTPGTLLDGLTFIVLGDGAQATGATKQNSGYVECVIPLTGSIPASGRFVITSATKSGGGDGDGVAFGVPGDLAYGTGFSLENSQNSTLMLISGFSGAINTDLDTDDDGILNSTPWTAVIDTISVVQAIRAAPTNSQLWWYAPRVGPSASGGSPFHVFRCEPVGYWQVGVNSAIAGTRQDTPGNANEACPDLGGGGNNCPGDLDGSLAVDAGDIGSLLILFGDCPNATPGCLGDLDNSGSVDAGDIGSLLILFGDCPV